MLLTIGVFLGGCVCVQIVTSYSVVLSTLIVPGRDEQGSARKEPEAI